MEEPFLKVEGAYFLDGGSVGVRIVDAQGRQADFCLPADQMGAGTGAALGGVVGNNVGSGNAGTGALIGAGAGGLIGNRVGAAQDDADRANYENRRRGY